MQRACIFLILAAAGTAISVCPIKAEQPEELWRHDFPFSLPCVPTVFDHDNDGKASILLGTAHVPSIQVLALEGQAVSELKTSQGLSGPVATSDLTGRFAFEEVSGVLSLYDYREKYLFTANLRTPVQEGAGTCLADLNGDGIAEVIVVRARGVITALDGTLSPLWQYDAGGRVSSPPAAASVLRNGAVVYVKTVDNMVHAVSGDGAPLWRTRIPSSVNGVVSVSGPIVAQFAERRPTLSVTNTDGWIYTFDAVDGRELWRLQAGSGDLGVPAIAAMRPGDGLNMVIVGEKGDCAVLDAAGAIRKRIELPAGDYVPRPLVADVDGDAESEIVVATRNETILIIGQDGSVEKIIALRGSAVEGVLLAPFEPGGLLHLLASTDCGQVVCLRTEARVGWTHPRGNSQLNGAIPPFVPQPLTQREAPRRDVRIELAAVRDYVERAPYTNAFLKLKPIEDAAYVSAAIRCRNRIVGSSFRSCLPDGIAVPHIQADSQPLSLDIAVFDSNLRLLAESTDLALQRNTLRLVELPDISELTRPLEQHADDFSTPTAWGLPSINGRNAHSVTALLPDTWSALGLPPEPFVSEALPAKSYAAMCKRIGDDISCASMIFACLRGASRQSGGVPWGVSISNGYFGAQVDTRFRAKEDMLQWSSGGRATGPDCGHSSSLELRLALSAYLAGGTLLRHESDVENGTVFARESEPGIYALSSFGSNFRAWYDLVKAYPDRGVPYTPIAFMVSDDTLLRLSEGIPVQAEQYVAPAVDTVLRHVFGCEVSTGVEQAYLHHGPYCELFDIISTSAAESVLRNYAVLWPLGEPSHRKTDQQKLIRYAENGGILVLDALNAEALPRRSLGVHFANRIEYATQIQTALAATNPVGAPFACSPIMAGRKSSVLAWTDAGSPVLASHPVKNGMVIVSGSYRWLDARGDLLPLAYALLGVLTDMYSPLQPITDVQTFLNRTPNGWIVGLINHHGVAKIPTMPAVVSPEAALDCVIEFKEGVPLRFFARRGQFNWSNRANGLQTKIQPGETVIVEVQFPPR